ncbi:NAD(P)/FAD-dependent oxidoreductase [Paracoccus sp. IB05]|uniref:phytoene desaturase family protein n=1 Tax=Paracoccus sp. IB05 TaxID=2779367 RepID=UPI001E359F7B|nr:NAD(P)/FAD-dependent oxidoreductase [Paracoccus sp. IB05]
MCPAKPHATNMAGNYDALIIGAGHNGLVCGAYLAKAGLKVCALERRNIIGGACVTEELWPGYGVNTAAHMLGLLQPKIILDLELQKYGYEVLTPPPTVQIFGDGDPVVLWKDPAKLCAEIARFSAKDAAAYPRFNAHLARLGPVFRQLLWEIPFDPSSLKPRNLRDIAGFAWRNRGMVGPFHEVVDLLTMSAGDYLDRWFESDAVKVMLGYYPAAGSGLSVELYSPGTAYFLLRGVLRDNGTAAGGTGLVKGGMGAVTRALAASGARHGLETRTGAGVARVLTRGGRACGVVLTDGTEIRADTVIANASAQHTFLDLVPAQDLPPEFLADIRGLRSQSTSFKVHLALNDLPRFPGLQAAGADSDSPLQITIAPSLGYLAKAWSDMRAGRVAERPFLTVQTPTLLDPSLAPAGMHLLSIYGGHVPAPDVMPHDAQTKELVRRNTIAAIRDFAPDFTGEAAHCEVTLAADFERIFGLPGGNPHHSDLSLSQIFFRRPARHFADYRSPVRGLFLCGASAHPGGAVTGVPGFNAACVVLKSLGKRTLL